MSTPAARALVSVLGDLAGVVDALSDEQYLASAIPGVSGSVGGHVRHCLDHVRALERAAETGRVDYDARERDTRVEYDRMLAWSLLRSACRRLLASFDSQRLARPVTVRTRLSHEGAPIEVLSSLGRELSFVIAHTIHHSATIAVLAGINASSLPRRFGVAPGTPLERVRVSCAR